MLELESCSAQQGAVDHSAEIKMVPALKAQIPALQSKPKTLKAKNYIRTVAVDKIVQSGGRAIAAHGELLPSLGFLGEGSFRRHHEVCDSSQKVTGHSWNLMANIFQDGAMRMQVWVD